MIELRVTREDIRDAKRMARKNLALNGHNHPNGDEVAEMAFCSNESCPIANAVRRHFKIRKRSNIVAGVCRVQVNRLGQYETYNICFGDGSYTKLKRFIKAAKGFVVRLEKFS